MTINHILTMASETNQYLKCNHTVVDLGCGPGQDSLWLSNKKMNKEMNLIASDISSGMMKILDDETHKRNLSSIIKTYWFAGTKHSRKTISSTKLVVQYSLLVTCCVYVRYLGHEFAHECIPTLITFVPSEIRQLKKLPKNLEKHENFRKTRTDSFRRFQRPFQPLFPIQLDELYPLQSLKKLSPILTPYFNMLSLWICTTL
ncbi:unnamed protein product [Adineta ricciae]|uniref:Methyltransferase domain-containing protein n=1 Tax=Adineta ricciae TaxID=249248 RepID=A0A815E7G9_ADIRI|nr:unnamed protein product [Adineta ricciae]